MRPPIAILTALVALAAAGGAAHAQPGGGADAYAIVIGSNPGGAGQGTLRFAEHDAGAVADVLRHLGDYPAGNVTLLEHPTPEEILAAIDRVGDRLRADASAGRQSVLFFYYSGHARAAALTLGAGELPLVTLRERIMALPSTLKIVVLDACQSGAFSDVKGAAPAADFSYNSVSRLRAAGVAVMASSSGSELSQESDRLGASYFTHYLLVALRGAGDVDGDGEVSLDEAYRYAYDRTLAATARTAVGRQHVTLETDLKGKGDVVLTTPARADAKLVLGAGLRAELLVQVARTGAVVAEVHKAAGVMHLALPNGSYQVLVRRGAHAVQCKVSLPPGKAVTLDPGPCPTVHIDDTAGKGGRHWYAPRWSVEATLGSRWADRGDAYTSRLSDFGYDEDFDIPAYWSIGASYRSSRWLTLVVALSRIDSGAYLRDGDTESDHFDWATHALTFSYRLEQPLIVPRLFAFGDIGAGVAMARSQLRVGERPADTELQWSLAGSLAVGLRLELGRFGIVARTGLEYAPALDNLLGDTRTGIGPNTSLGVTASF